MAAKTTFFEDVFVAIIYHKALRVISVTTHRWNLESKKKKLFLNCSNLHFNCFQTTFFVTNFLIAMVWNSKIDFGFWLQTKKSWTFMILTLKKFTINLDMTRSKWGSFHYHHCRTNNHLDLFHLSFFFIIESKLKCRGGFVCRSAAISFWKINENKNWKLNFKR